VDCVKRRAAGAYFLTDVPSISQSLDRALNGSLAQARHLQQVAFAAGRTNRDVGLTFAVRAISECNQHHLFGW
jgi:hypothetical protein